MYEDIINNSDYKYNNSQNMYIHKKKIGLREIDQMNHPKNIVCKLLVKHK